MKSKASLVYFVPFNDNLMMNLLGVRTSILPLNKKYTPVFAEINEQKIVKNLRCYKYRT